MIRSGVWVVSSYSKRCDWLTELLDDEMRQNAMGKDVDALNSGDVYNSPPNNVLLNHQVLDRCRLLLDVGAGTGSNLRVIRSRNQEVKFFALSCSRLEAAELSTISEEVVVIDLERLQNAEDLAKIGLSEYQFDVILMSHVLEHLRCPEDIVRVMGSVLKFDGKILIALPNICHWRMRIKHLLGHFDYEESGIMDKSHLRFFSFWSALDVLSKCDSLVVESHYSVGGAILGPLRKILPSFFETRIDSWCAKQFPNFFGYETHLVVAKKGIDL